MSFPKVAITVGKLSLPPSYFIADQVHVVGTDNATLHCLKYVSADRLPATLALTKTLPQAVAALVRSKPELVHQHWATWSTLGRLAAAAFHVPFVVSVHGYDAFLPQTPGPLGRVVDVVKKAERDAALKAADLVVVNSEFMRDRVRDLGVHARKVTLHRHAVDVQRFKPGGQPPNGRALYVGRLSPEKGPDLLLEAWSQIPVEQRLPLDIIGDGVMRDSLEEFAAAHDLPVTFHGRQNQDVVVAALQAAEFVICPSRSQTSQVEASGIVPLEAQACGTPVLVTAAGGLPEGVEPRARKFATADHPQQLATAIVRFVAEAPTLRDLAREYVLANHSLDVWAEQLAGIYSQAFVQRNVPANPADETASGVRRARSPHAHDDHSPPAAPSTTAMSVDRDSTFPRSEN